MPRKYRQLKADMRKGGFTPDASRGKGNHNLWFHPLLGRFNVNLPGPDKDGEDVRPYHEKQVREALRRAQEAERQQKKGR